MWHADRHLAVAGAAQSPEPPSAPPRRRSARRRRRSTSAKAVMPVPGRHRAPAPGALPPGWGNYRLGTGDKIRVVVLQDSNSRATEVDQTGHVSARMLGRSVAGMTTGDLACCATAERPAGRAAQRRLGRSAAVLVARPRNGRSPTSPASGSFRPLPLPGLRAPTDPHHDQAVLFDGCRRRIGERGYPCGAGRRYPDPGEVVLSA